jgi:hypothetical protein
MKFRFIVRGIVLFESDGGDLTVSKEVLDIGGFGNGSFEAVSFKIRDSVAELHFEESRDHGLTKSERDHVHNQKYIQAIKDVRARTGLGLREAKDVVDKYRQANPSQPWGIK